MIPRKEPSIIGSILAIIFGLFVIIASVVLTPFIVLLVGMAIGWLLEFVTGDYVVQAFNSVGLSGVRDGDLPKVFGVLALVAWLLRLSGSNVKSTRKGEDD